jgi:hypothetical protein
VSESEPFVVGIDPGATGYSCVLWARRRTALPSFVPNPYHDGAIVRGEVLALVRAWREQGVALVVVERQQNMSKGGVVQGGNSVWSVAFGYAVWLTALDAAGFFHDDGSGDVGEGLRRYVTPLSTKWKAHMGCMGAGGDRKVANALTIKAAQERWPTLDLRAVERSADPFQSRCTKPSPDKSAALLLAEYGRGLLGPRGVA